MRAIFWLAAGYVLVRVIGYSADPETTRRYHVEAAWFAFATIGWITAALSRPAGGRALASTRLTPREQAALFAGLAARVLVCYWPSLRVGLLSDDFSLINRAEQWTIFSTAQAEFFRPVPLVLWALVRSVTHDPIWLHALNLGTHALNGGLLALVALRVGVGLPGSIASAVLFVTFPAHVEAVAWISGLQDLAMTSACLLYLLALVGARATPVRGVLGIAALSVALLSKETAVIAPVLAMLLALLVPPDVRRAARVWLAAGLVVVAAYSAWRLSVLPPPADYDQTLTRYFGKELISRTFGTLAVPWHASVLQAAPLFGAWSAALALVTAIASVTVASLDRPSLGRATIFLVWSLVAVVPVYSYFFISPSLQGARYLYLPACGWMLFVGSTAAMMASLDKRWITRLAWTAVATMAVLDAAGTRWHQQPWTQAAALRDRVLDEAKRAVETSHCTAAETEVADLPDAVDGAYVFRNGFREALASVLPSSTTTAPRQPDERAVCRFRWTDRGLVRQSPSGGA